MACWPVTLSSEPSALCRVPKRGTDDRGCSSCTTSFHTNAIRDSSRMNPTGRLSARPAATAKQRAWMDVGDKENSARRLYRTEKRITRLRWGAYHRIRTYPGIAAMPFGSRTLTSSPMCRYEQDRKARSFSKTKSPCKSKSAPGKRSRTCSRDLEIFTAPPLY